MKRSDLAYVAGIIDGEGCISIRKDRRPKLAEFQLAVQVNMANEWIPTWLKFSFGGSLRQIKVKKGYQFEWGWTIQSQQARGFLELILPYLKIKRDQALIGIELQKNKDKRKINGKWRARTKIEYEAEAIAFDRLKAIHQNEDAKDN